MLHGEENGEDVAPERETDSGHLTERNNGTVINQPENNPNDTKSHTAN